MNVEKVAISNLINIDELKDLFSDFSEITGFPIGLLDAETDELLLGIGWRDICTEFHRAYPESEAYCKKSNQKLTAGLTQVGEIHIDHCNNDLVTACTPIIVQGQHLANLFTGQVLVSPPNREQFKAQAQKFGYDEQLYLESLDKVPIVTKERILSFLRYLTKKITLIAQKNLDLETAGADFSASFTAEKNKTQKLLNQGEQRLTLALDAANLGLWDWNILTDEVFFNVIYFSMLGFSPDDFPQTTETWTRLLHTEDRDRVFDIIQSALYTKDQRWAMEFRMHSATGGYRWVSCQGRVVELTKDGKPTRAIGVHQDITQQKLDEQILQEQKNKYRELFNNMENGVIIFNAVDDGNCFIIDEFNHAALKITRTSHEKIMGRKISQVFPGVKQHGLFDVLRRVYKTGSAEELPAVHYQDEVLDLWVDIYVYKLSLDRIVIIYNDYTERKRAENRIKEKQVQLEQIIDLATDAFVLADNEETIIQINQQITTLSGYSRDELIGQKFSMLFPKEDLEKRPLNYDSLKKGGILMTERGLLRRNGAIIPIELHSKMLPNGIYQSFIQDISERKKAEETLLENQRALKMKQLQLEESNVALKILLKQVESEKIEFEESVAANILSLAEPHLNKLKNSGLNQSQANLVEIIAATLNNLGSSFVRTSIAMNLKLSPAEIQVANLIKQGKTSKQIAEALGLSSQTIDKHRSHIRKKIGITNKDISLRELLTSKGSVR